MRPRKRDDFSELPRDIRKLPEWKQREIGRWAKALELAKAMQDAEADKQKNWPMRFDPKKSMELSEFLEFLIDKKKDLLDKLLEEQNKSKGKRELDLSENAIKKLMREFKKYKEERLKEEFDPQAEEKHPREQIPELADFLKPVASSEQPEPDLHTRKPSPKIEGLSEETQEGLERHPHVMDMKRFNDMAHLAAVHDKVQHAKETDSIPDKPIREWAKDLDASYGAVQSYLAETKTPELHQILDANEASLRAREVKLKPEAMDHRISPSEVYNNFRHLEGRDERTIPSMAKAIADMYRDAGKGQRVQWGELSPYHTGGLKWLRSLFKAIEHNRDSIEFQLNRELGLDKNPDWRIRVGVTDYKLYLREQDTRRHNWFNIYNNEVYHFHSVDDKRRIIENARARLGLSGNLYLSRLVDQMSEFERTKKGSQPNYDLRGDHNTIRGETLSVILDTLGMKMQDIESKLSGIGKGGEGILNPRFPEDKKDIDKMFATILGAGFSDGHLEKRNRGFVYTESNRDRVRIFNEHIDRFGDVHRCEDVKPNGVIRIRYSRVLGRALERWGMPVGDKAMQDCGLPSWFMDAPSEVKVRYYSALWAEDGSFHVDDRNRGVFQVDRGIALYDPSKVEEYNGWEKATSKHALFVKAHGVRTESELFGKHTRLTSGMLDDLTQSTNPTIAENALSLKETIFKNQPRLMVDERSGLETFGVKTNDYFVYVTHFEKTGRLSALWHYQTSSYLDAMRIGLSCPPDDIRKKYAVESWMNTRPDDKERIARELGQGVDV